MLDKYLVDSIYHSVQASCEDTAEDNNSTLTEYISVHCSENVQEETAGR